MSGRSSIIAIIAAGFVIVALSVSAQNERTIRWKAVYGSGGYIIEIKNSGGRVIVEREIISTSYDISKLNAGKYSYRITTLNKLKQRGKSTSWIEFTVEKAVLPEIKNISGKIIAWSYSNPDIIVKGSGFDQSTRLYLRKDTVKIELPTEYKSDTELMFSYDPESREAGTYDLVAINENKIESVFKAAVEIKGPDIPVIDSVSIDKIYNSTLSEIVLRGANMGTGTVPVIEDENGRRLKTKYSIVSDTEIIVTVEPLPSDNGKYNVYAMKNDLFVSEKKFRLIIADPVVTDKVALVKDAGTDNLKTDGGKHNTGPVSGENYDVPGDIYLGLAWEYNMPLGEWSDEIKASPSGLNIFIAYQLKGFSFINGIPLVQDLEIEAIAGYSKYDLSNATGAEYYSIMNCMAGFGYPVPVKFSGNSIYPVISINSGIAYSSVSIENFSGSSVYSSFDPVIYAGLSLRYKPGMFFADIECGYSRIFYVSHPLGEVKLSLRAGVVF